MSETKSKQILIRYSLDDFLNYQNANDTIPINIAPFCKERSNKLTFRDPLIVEGKTIIDNFLSGINPNDISFMSSVREYLNKINQKSYATYIEQLKKLNYTSSEHFDALADQLVLRAMMDSIVIKGFDLPEGQKGLSEIYADIAHEFSTFFIMDGTTEVKFAVKLMDVCQKCFTDFSNKHKPLDKNNQNRVDHFKGFMNFLGLLFAKGILSHKITVACLLSLKDLIFTSGWEQTECENVYDGYKKLMMHLINVMEKKLAKKLVVDVTYAETLDKIHTSLLAQNDATPKLRKFTIMVHKDLDSKLKKIIKSCNLSDSVGKTKP